MRLAKAVPAAHRMGWNQGPAKVTHLSRCRRPHDELDRVRGSRPLLLQRAVTRGEMD